MSASLDDVAVFLADKSYHVLTHSGDCSASHVRCQPNNWHGAEIASGP